MEGKIDREGEYQERPCCQPPLFHLFLFPSNCSYLLITLNRLQCVWETDLAYCCIVNVVLMGWERKFGWEPFFFFNASVFFCRTASVRIILWTLGYPTVFFILILDGDRCNMHRGMRASKKQKKHVSLPWLYYMSVSEVPFDFFVDGAR